VAEPSLASSSHSPVDPLQAQIDAFSTKELPWKSANDRVGAVACRECKSEVKVNGTLELYVFTTRVAATDLSCDNEGHHSERTKNEHHHRSLSVAMTDTAATAACCPSARLHAGAVG
jgi:hypothetical protein